MIPVDLNVVLYRGATWYKRFVVKRNGIPVDLTGATIKHQIRGKFADANPLISQVSGDEITIDPVAGAFEMLIPASRGLLVPAGRAVSDILIVFPGGLGGPLGSRPFDICSIMGISFPYTLRARRSTANNTPDSPESVVWRILNLNWTVMPEATR